jgi:hypothetical protein
MPTLADVATQIRSKNAGPVRLTLDVFFDDEAVYERVVEGDVITAATVADRYNVDEEDVLGIYELDRITTIKIALRRPVPAGDVRDSDVYGTQQHGPLLDVEV